MKSIDLRVSHGECRRVAHRADYRSPEYLAWYSMLQRVSPTFRRHRHYFDRGISVCHRWYKFENFLADMGRRPAPGLSIDRRNNNRGYSKSNCRWATSEQQNRNRQNSHRVRHVGKWLTLMEWSNRLGIKYITLFARYKRGERGTRLFRAPDEPTNRRCRFITVGGITKSLSGWSRERGIALETLRMRYNKGERSTTLFRKAKT